ncbi:MAG: chemotaxis protein CheW [Betaproteobacteria bacterium]|jgi:twitching motility protein PilI|nr:chemotaxis protein CheW [Burkholderiaceae bacterium]MCZ8110820.1 chemotaxis protein CheW [Rubrivivax sp.]MCZ8174182.1 chemotaxis protein CheW [Burkholderiaceae bacterium]
MANREALRELQSRLAERLQAARTETRSVSWLAVECAGAGLLVPLATAGEIFPAGALLPVPHTRPWFLGVANLRGGLHGVVDLAAFLGLRPPLARDAVRDQARLLAFNPRLGSHCAVLVDRLAGLRSQQQLQPDTDAVDAASLPAFAAGGRWRDADGRVWQEIDLAALARHEQFLAIAA